jgi:hypothetical protein
MSTKSRNGREIYIPRHLRKEPTKSPPLTPSSDSEKKTDGFLKEEINQKSAEVPIVNIVLPPLSPKSQNLKATPDSPKPAKEEDSTPVMVVSITIPPAPSSRTSSETKIISQPAESEKSAPPEDPSKSIDFYLLF